MYNRYIPQSDGTFQRNRIPDRRLIDTRTKQQHTQQPPQDPTPKSAATDHIPASTQNVSAIGFLRQLLPRNCDMGDLFIVLLLLLIAGDCQEEKSNALLTLAFYFFL